MLWLLKAWCQCFLIQQSNYLELGFPELPVVLVTISWPTAAPWKLQKLLQFLEIHGNMKSVSCFGCVQPQFLRAAKRDQQWWGCELVFRAESHQHSRGAWPTPRATQNTPSGHRDETPAPGAPAWSGLPHLHPSPVPHRSPISPSTQARFQPSPTHPHTVHPPTHPPTSPGLDFHPAQPHTARARPPPAPHRSPHLRMVTARKSGYHTENWQCTTCSFFILLNSTKPNQTKPDQTRPDPVQSGPARLLPAAPGSSRSARNLSLQPRAPPGPPSAVHTARRHATPPQRRAHTAAARPRPAPPHLTSPHFTSSQPPPPQRRCRPAAHRPHRTPFPRGGGAPQLPGRSPGLVGGAWPERRVSLRTRVASGEAAGVFPA